MYLLDIYTSDQLAGSIGVQDGKLIYEGDVPFMKALCAGVGGATPQATLKLLEAKYTGQGLYTRPHGATHLIEHLDTPAP